MFKHNTEGALLEKFARFNKYLQGHGGFIAGGFAHDVVEGKEVKDIDIFFKSKKHYLTGLKYFRSNQQYEAVRKGKVTYLFKDKEMGLLIELNRTLFAEVEEILDRFDFSIVKFAYVRSDNKYECVYDEAFFEDLKAKRLVCKNAATQSNLINRVMRYMTKGFMWAEELKPVLLARIEEKLGNG